MLPFHLEGKTNGQITEEIGRLMSKVGRYCRERKNPLIIEALDATLSNIGMRYGNKSRNQHASMFAYRKMTTCLEYQSYKQGFGILKVDPVYTSQMGKFLFMRKEGISIHVATSYTIGLKGIGMREKLLTDERLVDLLPVKRKEELKNGTDIQSLIPAWKELTDTFRGVRTHRFYQEGTYGILNTKKRKSLKSVRDDLYALLPIRDIKCDVPESERFCPDCDAPMEHLGYKTVREELRITPAKVERVRYLQETLVCPVCREEDDTTIRAAKTPTALLPHSPASPDMVAMVMYQKSCLYLPFYRQEKDWFQKGVPLPRETAAHWYNYCALEYLAPLYEALHQELLGREVIHADEVPCQVLHEEGKEATSKSYMCLNIPNEFPSAVR